MKKTIICLFVGIFTLCLTGCGKSNPIAGKYSCTYLTGQQQADFDIELNKNKTFKYDINGQALEGDYTYKYGGVTDENNKVKSYAITLSYKLDIKSDDTIDETTEFKILKSEDNIVFTFLDDETSRETMFTCKKK